MYFTELPEILYRDFDDRTKFKAVKNFFRRVRTKDDINSLLTFTTTYEIQDGETPEMVAYKFYQDPKLYWVILLVNNVINILDEWPLSTQELTDSVMEKYDFNAYTIRYYETIEVKNSIDQTILESGLIVNSNFTYTYRDNNVTTTLSGSQIVYPVTNFEHEERSNEKKRTIFVPRPNQINPIISQFEDLIKYDTDYGMDSEGRRIVDV